MWTSLAHKVIKYRFYFILAIVVVTAVMGYFAKDVELSYDFSRVVPPNDPDMAHYQRFKSLYGEEGEIIVIGARDSSRGIDRPHHHPEFDVDEASIPIAINLLVRGVERFLQE